ncbi:hypothetical protein V6N12_046074 [Hibiscus sabdariffa]|uniref:RNase H type-1 domain-containing protein n=1 Tax=Hibiscus sabdariffa TaxID=183260 RepID=A0ABR2G4U3_9ROSI
MELWQRFRVCQAVAGFSVEAVNLSRCYKGDEAAFSLVPHIAAILNRPWRVEIKRVLREGNKLVDSMAKIASFDDLICHHFLSPSEVVRRQFEEDFDNMSYDVG